MLSTSSMAGEMPSGPPYAVFCGLDVGKSDHHAVALDPSGRRLADRPLPNDEAALRSLFLELQTHGPVLAVVDQVAAIGALAVAVARSLGIDVGYLPGLTMRRLADLHPGEAKTDARDAFVIADAARALPHTLRRVATDQETLAELTILSGYDEDLAGEVNRLANRLADGLARPLPAGDHARPHGQGFQRRHVRTREDRAAQLGRPGHEHLGQDEPVTGVGYPSVRQALDRPDIGAERPRDGLAVQARRLDGSAEPFVLQRDPRTFTDVLWTSSAAQR